ncbi:pirin family protein [Streptosporangium sp. NPDC048047]|uniref:pirin family protein n=1 Tax=Streptosporangium sp. NPDC048047 TaxID=3155748 RepID=UPI00341F1846
MSDPGRDADQAVYGCAVAEGPEPESVLLPGHDVPLGRYTTVRRLLPQRPRRMVGAWCFVDHFGPDDVAGRPGMQIAPHPHTGLQTVTWLVEGEIMHRDSLGSAQPITPGQLNLMTAGHGIAHSEQSPLDHPPVMHGLQLWIALPEDARHGEARFEHHPALPTLRDGDATVTVVAGELGGVRSPALVHTPLVGAEVLLPAGGRCRIPLNPAFENAVLVMSGTATVTGTGTAPERHPSRESGASSERHPVREPGASPQSRVSTEPGTVLTPGSLLYLGRGRSEISVEAAGETRLFLLGGEPFEEPLVMWWNFVGRTHEEILRARDEWMRGDRRFGTVDGCDDDPLPAPVMPTVRLKARDRHGHTLG